MPAGTFVISYLSTNPKQPAQNVVLRTKLTPTMGEKPSMADCSAVPGSKQVRFARRIIFVGDDGGVWMMRDKWQDLNEPQLLREERPEEVGLFATSSVFSVVEWSQPFTPAARR